MCQVSSTVPICCTIGLGVPLSAYQLQRHCQALGKEASLPSGPPPLTSCIPVTATATFPASATLVGLPARTLS